jgi:[ribosomal protein S5]-alanine N-acetyltransferase
VPDSPQGAAAGSCYRKMVAIVRAELAPRAQLRALLVCSWCLCRSIGRRQRPQYAQAEDGTGDRMHFSALPRLEHELVWLRPLAASDVEPWFKYLSLPQVYEHTSWDVREPSELNHFAWKPEEFTASSPLRFAIALRSNNELIGSAGFHTVSPENGTAEFAYDVAPDYWGKGIGGAVCSQLVKWAHGAASVTRIQATVLESNARSAAVLERCGFSREGLLQAYRKVRGKHGNFYMYAHVELPTDS